MDDAKGKVWNGMWTNLWFDLVETFKPLDIRHELYMDLEQDYLKELFEDRILELREFIRII